MGRASAILLVFLFAACRDFPTAPEAAASKAPDEHTVIATFILQHVDGQPLPVPPPTGAGEWDYGTGVLELAAGTLELYDDGRYLMTWSQREKGVFGSPQSKMECPGTYVLTGPTSIRFDASSDIPTDGTLSPGGLVLTWGSFVLDFARS